MRFRTSTGSVYDFSDGLIRLESAMYNTEGHDLESPHPATMMFFGIGFRAIFKTDLGPLHTSPVVEVIDLGLPPRGATPSLKLLKGGAT
jgi:hypothetical protein